MLQCRESGKAAPQVPSGSSEPGKQYPEQAYLTVRNVLFEQDYYIDRDLTVRIIERDLAGRWWKCEMVNIFVVCVGKLKEKYWTEAVAEYSSRLGSYCRLEIVELKESRLPDRGRSG